MSKGKRKRGRPRIHSTPQAKAAADVKRKRAARQDASSAQRNVIHTNFYNLALSLESAESSEWVNLFSGAYPLANRPDAPQPDQRDISQFLTAVDHPQLEEDTEEQAIFYAGTPADVADSGPVLSYNNNNSPVADEAIGFDVPLEPSPQPENNEPDLAGPLAQKLAAQLVKFQGCCTDCHQAAKQSRLESPNAQTSLVQHMESTVGLGVDVLSSKTLAKQKDDLAVKISPEIRKKVFCGLDSGAGIPYEDLCI
ncbi:hypothetical protein V8C42DRAFT_356485 [Trichoderma barbatum]